MKRGEGKVISASGKAHSLNWRLIHPASNDNFYLWLMEILPKGYFILRYIRLQQVAFNSHSRHNKHPQIPCRTAFVPFSANLLLGLLRHDMSKVCEFGIVCCFFSFFFSFSLQWISQHQHLAQWKNILNAYISMLWSLLLWDKVQECTWAFSITNIYIVTYKAWLSIYFKYSPCK